jgi:uncharacterized cupin superfamily protein
MTDQKKKASPFLIRAADLAARPEESFRHPLNPSSEVRGHELSEPVGLKRVGLALIKIAPGKESFAYHAHHGEEEFMYVLSGRGIAEVDDQELEIGPGDFLGFPTPSVPHHVRNPFSEELVYLSGGERHAMEVADFPRLKKRMVRVGRKATLYPLDQGQPFP